MVANARPLLGLLFAGVGLTSAMACSAQAMQADTAPGSALVTAIAGRGIATCLQIAGTLAMPLIGPEGTYGAMLITHPVAPDAASFTATIERVGSTTSSLVSVFYAPTVRGGCDVSYERIELHTKSCQDVATLDLPGDRRVAPIGQRIGAAVLSPTHHVYFLRVPGGCVSIAKEMLYQ